MAQFPRTLDDLTDTTRCPACFTPLRSTTCAECGLDLTHPQAFELANVSAETAALLRRRGEIIERIRAEQANATAGATPPTAAAPPTAALAPVPAPAPAPAPVPALAPVPTEPRRHFGVQVLLLIVGVSLLAIGAIFFLVYAFITFGLVWRSLIIGAVTVAAFAGAWLLRRRRLTATAEAIAALAVVLFYLDAFALRANDLLGTAAVDGFVYWGVTLLVSSVGFVAWHRLSGLRTPSIAAFAVFAPAFACLVAGWTEPLDPTDRVFAAFAAMAIGGFVHVAAARVGPNHTTERVLAVGFGVLGLVVAAGTAFLLRPDSQWAAAMGLGIVAALALAHVLVNVRTHGPRSVGAVVGGIGAAAASFVALSAAVRADDSPIVRIAPVVAAAAVALALEALLRRTSGQGRPAALAAMWTSIVVGAFIALPSFAGAALGALSGATGPLAHGIWSVPGSSAIAFELDPGPAVAALAIVVALAAGAWQLGRRLARRRLLVLWPAAGVAIAAVPLTGVLWAEVAGWSLLAGFAVVLLVLARDRSRGVRVLLAVTGATAIVLGYTASWASTDTWWVGSLVAIVLLLASRGATAAEPARASLLGAALVLLLLATGAGAWRANAVLLGGAGSLPEAEHGVLAIAVVVLAIAAVLRGRVASGLDARVAFWVSTAAIALYAPSLFGAGDAVLVVPDPAASASLASGLIAALALWTTSPSTPRLRPERIVASIALAPAGALALQGLARLAGLHETVVVHVLAPVTAALIVAAASLAVRPRLRAARDAGAALVAGGALVWSIVADPDATWLVLLVAAVTALILAISRDGLFGSVSTRRHLVWASLALATASLWRALADNPTARLEAYVLPLAGALLVIALLTWRAHRPEPSRTAPFIALAGLLVAIVPLAVVARDGDLARTIAVFAAAVILAVLGGLPAPRAVRPYLDSAAFAGSLGVLLAASSRTAGMLDRGGRGDLAIDAWLAAALVVLAIAATAQSRLGGRVRSVIAQVLLGLGLGLVTVIELVAIDSGSLGAARAIALLVVLAVVHVTASVVARAPFTPAIAWLAIGLAAVTGLVVTARGVVDPLEGATAPIAAALLVAGAVHLRRVPAARSWATLAPGILVLLVPSLMATFVDDALWRLVALGLACVALIVVGALARLQAPLVIGSATVLVHAARTFAPQLRAIYESTEWWVWAVVGGSIILFLGFTLERRIRDLRSFATRVSALR